MTKIVLGGGCFWCIEAAYREVEGVDKATSGYSGGHVENPAYQEVCMGKTDHAEVVKLKYKPEIIDLENLLEIFFKIHNPMTKDREGPDIGRQYRSIIFYQNQIQKQEIQSFIQNKQDNYKQEIVTEVKKLKKFYPAEEKHQNYFEKNPDDAYCKMYARPKIKKAKRTADKNKNNSF